jgi:hypothetical protein
MSVWEFPFSPASPLDGIIAHLTRTFGGNVHERNVVTVTAFKPLSGDSAPRVVDLDSDSTYVSLLGPRDQWIALEFRKMTVFPMHYTLKTRVGKWAGRMKSWVIEGSVDGKAWRAMTELTSSDTINRPNVTMSFPITSPAAVRHVRFHMPPADGNQNIILSGFELFGILREAKSE